MLRLTRRILCFTAYCLVLATPAAAATNGAPIKITIKTEKQSYTVGEDIIVRLVVENTSDKALTLADDPLLLSLQVRDRSNGKNLIAPYFQAQVSSTAFTWRLHPFELAPHSSYVKLIDFGNWQIDIQEKGEHLGAAYYIHEFPNRYELCGTHTWSDELLKRFNRDGTTKNILSGSFQSGILTIEVVKDSEHLGPK